MQAICIKRETPPDAGFCCADPMHVVSIVARLKQCERPRLLELEPHSPGGLPKGRFLSVAGLKPSFKVELGFSAPLFVTPALL